jgi:hypothetical protein
MVNCAIAMAAMGIRVRRAEVGHFILVRDGQPDERVGGAALKRLSREIERACDFRPSASALRDYVQLLGYRSEDSDGASK